ncbi:LysR family transcriptional regulator [Kiloniella litopenaei]|uniref:LysR family transcriptional regulator n=1 Tax=Kiloniella litopenaei TaxID=1549748 RepID=UPI003BA86689
MKLLDMETFVAVARAGSFAGASATLGITSSAASRRIARLEDSLQVKLLYRTTRALSLTEAGDEFLIHAQSALLSAENAVDAVKSHQSSPEGHLRVHAPMSYGKLHVSPLIPEFLDQFPNLKISLFLDDKIPDLLDANLDVAITGRHISSGSYIARKVGALTSVLCAAPHYLEHHGAVQHPQDLSAHNCLFYHHSENTPYWIFNHDGISLEVEVSGNFLSDSSEAVHNAALKGMGIARIPRFLANPDLKAGRLIELLPDFVMPEKLLFTVYPDREHKPAKLNAFLEFFIPRLATP